MTTKHHCISLYNVLLTFDFEYIEANCLAILPDEFDNVSMQEWADEGTLATTLLTFTYIIT